MQTLTKTFKTKSRNETASIAHKIADTIRQQLTADLDDENPPIVIAINGPQDSGKSIFWDEIRQHLFDHGGIFVRTKSESSQRWARGYETWIGEFGNKSKTYRMLLGNINQMYFDALGFYSLEDLTNRLYGKKSDTEYDVLVISNPCSSFMPANKHTIEIEITSPTTISINIPETSPWATASIIPQIIKNVP